MGQLNNYNLFKQLVEETKNIDGLKMTNKHCTLTKELRVDY